MERITTQCCIAGGGPAGLVLGYLLARYGVEVQVLEKHNDFLRDFRGDTIHPSTLEVMHQLDLIDGLLSLPHQRLFEVYGVFGDETLKIANFRDLPTKRKFVALMPQWDFLNFLAEEAAKFPSFRLRMASEVTEFTTKNGRIAGVRAETSEGPLEVAADLIVAADGRDSKLREQTNLPQHDLGAPMDVLWFKLAKNSGSGRQPLGRFDKGQILVLLDRDTYWQCGYVIPKGGLAKWREEGFEAFCQRVSDFVPSLKEPLTDLSGWNDTSLLVVQVKRLESWYRPGLLFIGDSAHAMSPVGGIGINLAIQDAVAAANILAVPLRNAALQDRHLRAVQTRREWPTRLTQSIQVLVQNRLIADSLDSRQSHGPPLILRMMTSIPLLDQLPTRFIGLGLRRENVASHLLA